MPGISVDGDLDDGYRRRRRRRRIRCDVLVRGVRFRAIP